jgi:hypothetical protein
MIYKGTVEFLWKVAIEFNFLEWIVGIITTFLLIYFFRASIKIGNIAIIEDKIKIPIINDSSFFTATNIITEVALINDNETFHFRLDRKEFILIPRKCKKCNNEQHIRSYLLWILSK